MAEHSSCGRVLYQSCGKSTHELSTTQPRISRSLHKELIGERDVGRTIHTITSKIPCSSPSRRRTRAPRVRSSSDFKLLLIRSRVRRSDCQTYSVRRTSQEIDASLRCIVPTVCLKWNRAGRTESASLGIDRCRGTTRSLCIQLVLDTGSWINKRHSCRSYSVESLSRQSLCPCKIYQRIRAGRNQNCPCYHSQI